MWALRITCLWKWHHSTLSGFEQAWICHNLWFLHAITFHFWFHPAITQIYNALYKDLWHAKWAVNFLLVLNVVQKWIWKLINLRKVFVNHVKMFPIGNVLKNIWHFDGLQCFLPHQTMYLSWQCLSLLAVSEWSWPLLTKWDKNCLMKFLDFEHCDQQQASFMSQEWFDIIMLSSYIAQYPDLKLAQGASHYP
jgi:hypothetical protein